MKIGIIGAMEIEVETLIGQLSSCTRTQHAGMEFCEGMLEGVACVIVRSGVGKVNAALCAQLLVSVYGVTHVINTGAAGSLDASINIGDIVVSTDCVQHDVDATIFGYELGQVPGMPVSYESSEPMAEHIVASAHHAATDIGVHRGRIASGDQFVGNSDAKERIIRDFQARCCDMEGASIAQACALNGVPFVVVRSISDKADGSDFVSYDQFERKAARDSAHIVREALAALSREA